ncbi:MAG: hypothetical protein J7M09_04285 [Deltaproteobacteria bacterium]|nr:hypothetical protein [Candidatus Tharpella sp.]
MNHVTGTPVTHCGSYGCTTGKDRDETIRAFSKPRDKETRDFGAPAAFVMHHFFVEIPAAPRSSIIKLQPKKRPKSKKDIQSDEALPLFNFVEKGNI